MGKNAPELSQQESDMRDKILTGGMGLLRAHEILDKMDPHSPMSSTAEFIQLILAHVTVFSDEVDIKTHVAGQTCRKLLWNETSSDRMEWLFNNTRLRASADPCHVALLPTGSTCNEAHNKEINARFRNMPELHLPTLELQLRVFQLSSPLKHCCAATRPTLRQLRPRSVFWAGVWLSLMAAL